jgi:hypothetical protein
MRRVFERPIMLSHRQFIQTSIVAGPLVIQLEHEDMDMMRPFVVAPAAAMTAMGMGPSKKNAGIPGLGMQM